MAGRESLPTSVFTVVALLLLGLGGAWWLDAEPAAPPPTPAQPSEGYTSLLMLEFGGSLVYERREKSALERILAIEMPCGMADGRSLRMGERWMRPVQEASPLAAVCGHLRTRGR